MNWRRVYPNVAPLVEKEPQNEEIYLSSDGEDENTVDSEMDMETKNDYINEHVIKNGMPEDKNVRICEEEKSKEPVSSEDIPPDSKNGTVQGSLRKKDIRRINNRPGNKSYISYDDYTNMTLEAGTMNDTNAHLDEEPSLDVRNMSITPDYSSNDRITMPHKYPDNANRSIVSDNRTSTESVPECLIDTMIEKTKTQRSLFSMEEAL